MQLERHVKTVHKKIKLWFCGHCSFGRFPTHRQLCSHVNLNHPHNGQRIANQNNAFIERNQYSVAAEHNKQQPSEVPAVTNQFPVQFSNHNFPTFQQRSPMMRRDN